MQANPIQSWRTQTKRYGYLGKRGRLISFSEVVNAPQELAAFSPYWVGVVELETKEKIAAPIISPKRPPKKGDRVVGVLRRLKPPDQSGIIEYGVKFQVQ